MTLKEMIKTGKTTFEEVESAIHKMRLRISELETMHYQDQAEIVRLRRQIGAEDEQRNP